MAAEEMTRWLAEHFASYATKLHQEQLDGGVIPLGDPAKDLPGVIQTTRPTPIRRTGNGKVWPQ